LPSADLRFFACGAVVLEALILLGLALGLLARHFGWLPTAVAFPCFRVGMLPLPVWLFACGVGLSLFSCRHVAVAGLAACLRRWPLLVFMSVYLHCPCAGRHSLFFAGRKEK
jgi:hypothetical protein